MPSSDSSYGSPAFTDLTNRKFGDYQILRRIGTGAMADVYVAQQISLGRLVAIKVLKPDLSMDETYVKRFVREAKAAASLVHQNIVHIYEVGQYEGYWCIVQEYIQGINLAQLLQQRGAMMPKQALMVMWQVASALELAAKSGIVHRDIKPENILITEKMEIKVADFGLARVDDSSDAELQLTKIGMTLGTPLYMSPEQSEGKTLDHRSDIYSFGITSYHMIAGFPPFRGDTALSVALQHLKAEPEKLELLRPDLPPAMARIIHKMIAKDPSNRYQTLKKLKTDLKQVHAQSFRDDSSVSETLSDWDTLQLDGLDTSLIAAADRLQTTMQLETKTLRNRRKHTLLIVICAVFVFVFGAVLGMKKESQQKIVQLEALMYSVPKMDTVKQQWAFASQKRTPQAWQAVIDNFPEENYWSRMAQRQLAWYFFEAKTPKQARLFFQELSRGDQQEDIQFGIAGMAWVFAAEGDQALAEKHLQTLAKESIAGGGMDMAFLILEELKRKYDIPVSQYIQQRRP